MKTALYAGSFYPFTIAHADIVERALKLFDKVIICFAINPKKDGLYDKDKKETEYQRVKKIYANAGVTNIEVVFLEYGAVAKYALERNCCSLIRGVRNENDYKDESTLANINKSVFGIETIILQSDKKYEHISSTLVRSLYEIGANEEAYNMTFSSYGDDLNFELYI